MSGFRAFGRKSLTKLIPVSFALTGLAVNSSLGRLIPFTSIHLESPARFLDRARD